MLKKEWSLFFFQQTNKRDARKSCTRITKRSREDSALFADVWRGRSTCAAAVQDAWKPLGKQGPAAGKLLRRASRSTWSQVTARLRIERKCQRHAPVKAIAGPRQRTASFGGRGSPRCVVASHAIRDKQGVTPGAQSAQSPATRQQAAAWAESAHGCLGRRDSTRRHYDVARSRPPD